jgi:hypothetical protein
MYNEKLKDNKNVISSVIRSRTDNTMTIRSRTDNTMTKRSRTDNTMTKRSRTDNTMTKRSRTDNTMTKKGDIFFQTINDNLNRLFVQRQSSMNRKIIIFVENYVINCQRLHLHHPVRNSILMYMISIC